MGIQAAINADCERRTEQAIDQVNKNADEEWKAKALEIVGRVAKEKYLFSSNDLWPFIDQPREPRALGAVLLKAQSLKWIRTTAGYTESNRPAQHRRPILVWRSLVYQGES